MDNTLLNRLIASVQQGRLVVFCGAGLSMAAPSLVPSAAKLAEDCIEEYNRRALPPLPTAATANLEALTEYLFGNGYQSLFLHHLVSWRPFRRDPNKGHVAVADLLTCGAVQFAVSTNYDELVELSAMQLGVDNFKAALDSHGANLNHGHRTFLKLHGCVHDLDHTLWCKSQLDGSPPVSSANETLRTRLASAQGWLRASLPEKDLIFIGFWSDWNYLIHVLADSLSSVHVPLVLAVDPANDGVLSDKAPELWNWAKGATEFIHVEEKGEQFLEQLRAGFSQNLLGRVLLNARPGFEIHKPGAIMPPTVFDGLSIDDLYAWRRDTYGVSSARVPRFSQPEDSMDALGRAHLLLRHAEAKLDGSRYVTKAGQRIRVINGKTKLISQVKKEFSEEPPTPGSPKDDFVLCAGATEDGGVPSHIVRGSPPPTVIRAGTTAEWITLDAGIANGLC